MFGTFLSSRNNVDNFGIVRYYTRLFKFQKQNKSSENYSKYKLKNRIRKEAKAKEMRIIYSNAEKNIKCYKYINDIRYLRIGGRLLQRCVYVYTGCSN